MALLKRLVTSSTTGASALDCTPHGAYLDMRVKLHRGLESVRMLEIGLMVVSVLGLIWLAALLIALAPLLVSLVVLVTGALAAISAGGYVWQAFASGDVAARNDLIVYGIAVGVVALACGLMLWRAGKAAEAAEAVSLASASAARARAEAVRADRLAKEEADRAARLAKADAQRDARIERERLGLGHF